MNFPPVPATNWRTWTTKDFAGQNSRHATNLHWLTNPDVTQILNVAFRERLPRSTGWAIDSSLDPGARQAVKNSATIYKRGVDFEGQNTSSGQKSTQGSYQIKILPGPAPIIQLLAENNFLVVDQSVHQLHGTYFENRKNILIIAIDEHSKNLATVSTIIAAWEKAGSPAKWCIVGGGIVTDSAAFAASLVGAACSYVPTTLLAMADACIGGKTGVNVQPFGKNLAGHFYFPTEVLVWTGWLATLPERDLIAGAFECIKHCILKNDLTTAETVAAATKKKNIEMLSSLLPTIIRVKSAVVAEDPTETGKRAILNFGHTLGHALEGLSQQSTKLQETILHGEAVGLGMMFATQLSVKLSGLDRALADRILKCLAGLGSLADKKKLSAFFGGTDPASEEVVSALAGFINQDKKAGSTDADKSSWILLNAAGAVNQINPRQWLTPISMSEFRTTWTEFLKILS